MTPTARTEEILAKYTGRLASQKSIAVDRFIGEYIPKWQRRIMFRFDFTIKLFGWEIERQLNANGFLGETIRLKRYGKLVGQLVIVEKIKYGGI